MAVDGSGAQDSRRGLATEIGRVRDLVTALLDYVDELEAEVARLRGSGRTGSACEPVEAPQFVPGPADDGTERRRPAVSAVGRWPRRRGL